MRVEKSQNTETKKITIFYRIIKNVKNKLWRHKVVTEQFINS